MKKCTKNKTIQLNIMLFRGGKMNKNKAYRLTLKTFIFLSRVLVFFLLQSRNRFIFACLRRQKEEGKRKNYVHATCEDNNDNLENVKMDSWKMRQHLKVLFYNFSGSYTILKNKLPFEY